MMKNRYTIVVSTCDSYSDLWDPFFLILKAEWDGLDEIPIVLNTESKSYHYEGLNIKTMGLCDGDIEVSWTERLRRTLERIDTDYIIFLLDDFFMYGKVQSAEIDKHIKWLDENSDVSMFCYKETYASKNIRDNRFDGFERRPLIAEYKFNCQAGLWRRKRLISYLKKDENPWEWEIYGNWRSYRHPFHHFYSIIPGSKKVFPYTTEINGQIYGGSGVYRGKWHVQSVDPIFKKHGIQINYSIRGTVSSDEFGVIKTQNDYDKKKNSPQWKQKIWLVRLLYCGVINALSKTLHFLSNIKHFL